MDDKSGKKTRDERRARNKKQNLEETNVTPGPIGDTFDEGNYETNKGNQSAKKLIHQKVGDCDLEDMSLSEDKADLNDL